MNTSPASIVKKMWQQMNVLPPLEAPKLVDKFSNNLIHFDSMTKVDIFVLKDSD